jgi:hypothetical protein
VFTLLSGLRVGVPVGSGPWTVDGSGAGGRADGVVVGLGAGCTSGAGDVAGAGVAVGTEAEVAVGVGVGAGAVGVVSQPVTPASAAIRNPPVASFARIGLLLR